MNMVNVLLFSAAAVLVAVTAAGEENLRRRSTSLPLVGYVIGGAGLIGNAASLLPNAPGWYRVAVVALTLAGLAWFVVSAAAAGVDRGAQGVGGVRGDRQDDWTMSDADIAARDIYSGRIPTRPVPARPALRLVHSQPVTPASSDAIHPIRPMDPTDLGAGPRPVATQATFAAAGPAGAHRVSGATYVAAHLQDYVQDYTDARGTRRRHGRHVSRRHDQTDPTVRFLRLADAYGIDRGPRSLGRSSLA